MTSDINVPSIDPGKLGLGRRRKTEQHLSHTGDSSGRTLSSVSTEQRSRCWILNFLKLLSYSFKASDFYSRDKMSLKIHGAPTGYTLTSHFIWHASRIPGLEPLLPPELPQFSVAWIRSVRQVGQLGWELSSACCVGWFSITNKGKTPLVHCHQEHLKHGLVLN